MLAVLLVLARSAAFLFWEHIDFDSDQAIVGLMAKHLSEFRTFPLFFYDQNYMLGVQSWIIAPFFWIARPSIAVLKTPLVLLNIAGRPAADARRQRPARAAAGCRIRGGAPVHRADAGRRRQLPADARQQRCRAAAVCAVPLDAARAARSRSARCSRSASCIASSRCTRFPPSWSSTPPIDPSWTADAPRWLMRMAAGFALVWLIIDDLRLHLDGMSLLLQAQMLGKHACCRACATPGRLRSCSTVALPVLAGGTTMPLDEYAMRSSAVVGSSLIGWMVGGALLLMLRQARVAVEAETQRTVHRALPSTLRWSGVARSRPMR